MKKRCFGWSLWFLLLIGFDETAISQTERSTWCGLPEVGARRAPGRMNQRGSLAEMQTTLAIQNGGQWMTAKDTVHVLIVFVQFPDDNNDPSNSLWPANSAPTFMNTYIDSLPSQASTNGNLTHYFRVMSQNRLILTGKTRFVIAPHSNQWYIDNDWKRWVINKEVLQTLDVSLDFSEFDRWKRYSEYDVRKESDGWVDMVFMIYRNVNQMSTLDFYGGEASLGYAREGSPYYEAADFFVDNNQRKIGNGHPVFGDPGSGTTSVLNTAGLWQTPYRGQIHEFAHHWMTNGSYFGHNGGGFWGMLDDWAARATSDNIVCANSFERELLGWMEPDSIYQSTSSFSLTDYITTGKAVKIKVPGTNPNEYFRLEYHAHESQFDGTEVHDPSAKGLYIIHQFGVSNPWSDLRLLPADGKWAWTSDELVYPSYYPAGLAVYKRSSVDRVNGYDDSRVVPFTWIGSPPTPSVPNPSWIHFYRDRQTNEVVEQTIFSGDGHDAFSLSSERVFTPWSNPNTQNSAEQMSWIAVEIMYWFSGKWTPVV